MTGLDFSASAVAEATRLAAAANADATFVQGNVYDAVELLGAARFDLVFTGIGALCWLPDIRRWAGVVDGPAAAWRAAVPARGAPGAVVARLRAHRRADRHRRRPTSSTSRRWSTSTRARTSRPTTSSRTRSRTPGTTGSGEIVTALLDRGLVLTMLEEHDSVPWEALPGVMERDGHEWRLKDRPRRLPARTPCRPMKPRLRGDLSHGIRDARSRPWRRVRVEPDDRRVCQTPCASRDRLCGHGATD